MTETSGRVDGPDSLFGARGWMPHGLAAVRLECGVPIDLIGIDYAVDNRDVEQQVAIVIRLAGERRAARRQNDRLVGGLARA